MSQTRTPVDEDTSSRFWLSCAKTGDELPHAHRFLPERFTDKSGIFHISCQGFGTFAKSLRPATHPGDFTALQGNGTLHTLTLTLQLMELGRQAFQVRPQGMQVSAVHFTGARHVFQQ